MVSATISVVCSNIHSDGEGGAQVVASNVRDNTAMKFKILTVKTKHTRVVTSILLKNITSTADCFIGGKNR